MMRRRDFRYFAGTIVTSHSAGQIFLIAGRSSSICCFIKIIFKVNNNLMSPSLYLAFGECKYFFAKFSGAVGKVRDYLNKQRIFY